MGPTYPYRIYKIALLFPRTTSGLRDPCILLLQTLWVPNFISLLFDLGKKRTVLVVEAAALSYSLNLRTSDPYWCFTLIFCSTNRDRGVFRVVEFNTLEDQV
ncbi:hypothetical protein L6164_034535 [Bauhinia variegata]|uniref:Uncharacterized protein n=1 Tax=Bauhinia variegata TaxID=167791 RepID=A0ACB9KVJ5_BAUVA|nr:hypothetical protein L6164_034535 [Bauhinia variegata]